MPGTVVGDRDAVEKKKKHQSSRSWHPNKTDACLWFDLISATELLCTGEIAFGGPETRVSCLQRKLRPCYYLRRENSRKMVQKALFSEIRSILMCQGIRARSLEPGWGWGWCHRSRWKHCVFQRFVLSMMSCSGILSWGTCVIWFTFQEDYSDLHIKMQFKKGKLEDEIQASLTG